MIAGLVLFGMVAGGLAAIVGLISGLPIFAAFLLYSGFGVASLLAGALVTMSRSTARTNPKAPLSAVHPDP